MKKTRELRDQDRRVVALWTKNGKASATKTAGAQLFIDTAIANSSVDGVFVAVVDRDGRIDWRVFGAVTRQNCAWIGAQVLSLAQHGGQDE